MSIKIFTENQIKILSSNQYVSNVSDKAITYTDEFKHIFMSENEIGKLPRLIFEEHGFDIDIVGMERVKSSGKRWRRAYRNEGILGLIYPPSTVTINRYSYIPYMFSEEEIKTIFHVCDHYQISDCSPNRHLILPLLFRILYGCWLRISEALNLTFKDVDLERGTLFIRNAKFGKERIVPMARSLSERCRVYMEELNSNKVT